MVFVEAFLSFKFLYIAIRNVNAHVSDPSMSTDMTHCFHTLLSWLLQCSCCYFLGYGLAFRKQSTSDSSYQISSMQFFIILNFRMINFAASRNLLIKSIYFEHKDIHKGTWKSLDNQTTIGLVFIDGRTMRGASEVQTLLGLSDRETTHCNYQQSRN